MSSVVIGTPPIFSVRWFSVGGSDMRISSIHPHDSENQ